MTATMFLVIVPNGKNNKFRQRLFFPEYPSKQDAIDMVSGILENHKRYSKDNQLAVDYWQGALSAIEEIDDWNSVVTKRDVFDQR